MSTSPVGVYDMTKILYLSYLSPPLFDRPANLTSFWAIHNLQLAHKKEWKMRLQVCLLEFNNNPTKK